MAKLYYTEEIGEVIDKKLERMSKEIIMNTRLDGEELLNAVHDFRTMQANLYSFIHDLEDEDAAYDAKMAALKAKEEAKNGTDT